MTTRVLIDSPAVAHGIGLFETMLAIEGRILHHDAHRSRLLSSALSLGFPPIEIDEFDDAVKRAAEEGRHGVHAIRCWYVAGGKDLDDPQSWVFEASWGAIPEVTIRRKRDGRAITLPREFTRSMPQHKMTSYASCILGLRRALAAGAEEALFVDRDGAVLEGTSTNVFAVSGSTLITSAVEAGVLPGIIRQWVIDEATRLGLSVEERSPQVDELLQGGFFTGSLTGIAPIRFVEGRACADPGEIVHTLGDLYARLCQPA